MLAYSGTLIARLGAGSKPGVKYGERELRRREFCPLPEYSPCDSPCCPKHHDIKSLPQDRSSNSMIQALEGPVHPHTCPAAFYNLCLNESLPLPYCPTKNPQYPLPSEKLDFIKYTPILQSNMKRPDGVVGYHVSLTRIRSWDRTPVWSFILKFSTMRMSIFCWRRQWMKGWSLPLRHGQFALSC